MNPRIQELALQAGAVNVWEWASDDVLDTKNMDAEKFAELIVKECGDWIINNAGAMEHLGPLYFAKAMQKDFGVEE